MALFRIILTVCLISAVPLAAGSSKDAELKAKLQELPFMERALMLATSKLRPETFRGLPIQEYLFDDYEHQWIDAAFVDLRSLLIQARKLNPTESIPELDYSYLIDACGWFICLNLTVSMQSSNSKIVGVEDIISETVLTPTTIRNTYLVPHLKWSSPGFVFSIINNYEYGEFQYRDMHISVDNMNTIFQANYAFVPDLGIQLSNSSIDFSMTSYINYLNEFRQIHYDGNITHDGPYMSDYAVDVVESWDRYRTNYTSAMEFRINCLLSGGRVDPVECENPGEYYDHIGYYKMNVVQLFETLGLASLSR